MKKITLLFLLVSFPLMQGCAVALIGAGIGAAKAGGAKRKQAETEEKEKYGIYRVEMEKINLEREKAGLKPSDIMPFEKWLQEDSK